MTDRGGSYLVGTPMPGEIGNSIIYGHNYANIFGRLVEVRPGDKVVVKMLDGTERNFEVRATQEVGPEQTLVLEQTKDSRLTIYTCSGLFDSRRFVVVASRV